MKRKFLALLTIVLLLAISFPVSAINSTTGSENISTLSETPVNTENEAAVTLESEEEIALPKEQEPTAMGEEPQEVTKDGTATPPPDRLLAEELYPPEIELLEDGTEEKEQEQDEGGVPKDQEVPQVHLVNSFEEFLAVTDEAAVGENPRIITLGADIIVPSGKSMELSNCEVHTKEYGITAFGTIESSSHTVITGDGVLRPVIEVMDGGEFYLSPTVDQRTYISTLSDNGVAISVRAGGTYQTFSAVQISAPGGTAIVSEAPLDLENHTIEAESGVLSTAEVRLFLSRINAEMVSVQAPNIAADTSLFSPAPMGNTQSIRRKISRIEQKGEILDLGDTLYEDGWPGPMRSVLTLRAEGVKDKTIVDFITLTETAFDTAQQGDYPVAVEVSERFRPFDLIDENVLLHTIQVRDLRVPVFDALSSSLDAFYLDYICKTDMIDPFVLWRSDDEGETWFNITDCTEISITNAGLSITLYELEEHSILFAWEVEGHDITETVRVTWDGNNAKGAHGGDRSGIDRGESEQPPSNIGGKPTPTPNQENNGGVKPTPKPSQENNGGVKPTATPNQENNGGVKPTPKPSQENNGGVKPTPTPSQENNGGVKPTPKPSQENNGGVKPTATPNQENNGGVKPTPKPSQENNGGVKPTAKPNQENNGGVKPTAKPNQENNGGVKPTPKPSQENNGGVKPTAKPNQENNGGVKPTPTPNQEKIGSSGITQTKMLSEILDWIAPASKGQPDPKGNKTADLIQEREATMLVSGQSLKVMMEANPNYVTLMSNGMWVSIPTDYLQNSNIQDIDTFHLYLEKEESDSFSVIFSLNNVQFEKPFEAPFLVSIPWDDGVVSCVSENGDETVAEMTDRKAVFSLTDMGTYQLSVEKQAIPAAAVLQEELPILMGDNRMNSPETGLFGIKINENYKEDFLPIAMACGTGILGAAAFFTISWKRRKL